MARNQLTTNNPMFFLTACTCVDVSLYENVYVHVHVCMCENVCVTKEPDVLLGNFDFDLDAHRHLPRCDKQRFVVSERSHVV